MTQIIWNISLYIYEGLYAFGRSQVLFLLSEVLLRVDGIVDSDKIVCSLTLRLVWSLSSFAKLGDGRSKDMIYLQLARACGYGKGDNEERPQMCARWWWHILHILFPLLLSLFSYFLLLGFWRERRWIGKTSISILLPPRSSLTFYERVTCRSNGTNS